MVISNFLLLPSVFVVFNRLVNAHYIYLCHPRSIGLFSGCILEPARIWQPPANIRDYIHITHYTSSTYIYTSTHQVHHRLHHKHITDYTRDCTQDYTQITSYNLQVASYKLPVTSFNANFMYTVSSTTQFQVHSSRASRK